MNRLKKIDFAVTRLPALYTVSAHYAHCSEEEQSAMVAVFDYERCLKAYTTYRLEPDGKHWLKESPAITRAVRYLGRLGFKLRRALQSELGTYQKATEVTPEVLPFHRHGTTFSEWYSRTLSEILGVESVDKSYSRRAMLNAMGYVKAYHKWLNEELSFNPPKLVYKDTIAVFKRQQDRIRKKRGLKYFGVVPAEVEAAIRSREDIRLPRKQRKMLIEVVEGMVPPNKARQLLKPYQDYTRAIRSFTLQYFGVTLSYREFYKMMLGYKIWLPGLYKQRLARIREIRKTLKRTTLEPSQTKGYKQTRKRPFLTKVEYITPVRRRLGKGPTILRQEHASRSGRGAGSKQRSSSPPLS